MRRQLRWYGASPLHLLALLACFGLAGYAAARLVSSRPLAVAAWFIGAVIGHDLLLMPLYSLADRSVMAAIRHRDPQLPVTPWINYIRVPAALSGLLLLVWFPLILRLRSPYHASTTLSADPYVWHWLAVTGALFLLSAVAFALRLRRRPRTAARPEPPAAAAAVVAAPDAAAAPDAGGGHEADPGHPGQTDPGQTDPGQADPGQADPGPGQQSAMGEEREPEDREPEGNAGELTPAEEDSRQDPPESSAGRPQPAAEGPDAPGPVPRPPAGPPRAVRPADAAHDAE
jgi:hypothetical protein